MPNVCVIQHVDCETPGLLDEVLRARRVATTTVCAHRGQIVPRALNAFDGLIVMGGPQGVYEQDRYPYLTAELRLIESALQAGKPILGTCLGSQLLATALGATVVRGPQKEIGWYELMLTAAAGTDRLFQGLPARFPVVHWHGDVFDLPPGTVKLASSGLTPIQAFRHGTNVYGLLFHMEMTARIIRDLVALSAEELRAAGADGDQILRDTEKQLAALHRTGRVVFERWTKLLANS